MPSWTTSPGSFGSARFTAFCTFTRLMSGSVPALKVTSVRSSTSVPSMNVLIDSPRSEILSVCAAAGSSPFGKNGERSFSGRIRIPFPPGRNTCGRRRAAARSKLTCHM